MKESAVFGGESPRNSRRSERQSESKTSAVMGFALMSRRTSPWLSYRKKERSGSPSLVCAVAHIFGQSAAEEKALPFPFLLHVQNT